MVDVIGNIGENKMQVTVTQFSDVNGLPQIRHLVNRCRVRWLGDQFKRPHRFLADRETLDQVIAHFVSATG